MLLYISSQDEMMKSLQRLKILNTPVV